MASVDLSNDPFGCALDEIGRSQPGAWDGGRQFYGPGPGARLDLGPVQCDGGQARWGLAMDWVEEPSAAVLRPPGARELQPAGATPDIVEAVRRELGLGASLTEKELTDRWRAFVWRNHPDRQPGHAREQANARVAVANALYDGARRALRRD